VIYDPRSYSEWELKRAVPIAHEEGEELIVDKPLDDHPCG
jgi:hypothetical protein